jgi:predicted RNA-binding Zn-ribbon protein involved in translation (DUF1610 family)
VTRIRASCPDCGEIDLLPDDVVLRIVRAPDGLVGDGSVYRFVCPSCTDIVAKPADERIAQLLTTGGVEVQEGEPVAELPPHPEFPAPGDALDHDDLLDFHLLLQRDDWFAGLLVSTPH